MSLDNLIDAQCAVCLVPYPNRQSCMAVVTMHSLPQCCPSFRVILSLCASCFVGLAGIKLTGAALHGYCTVASVIIATHRSVLPSRPQFRRSLCRASPLVSPTARLPSPGSRGAARSCPAQSRASTVLSLSQDSNISDRFIACADGDGDIICSEGVPMSDADVDGLRSVFEAASLGATEVTLNDPTPSATRSVTSSPTDELSNTPAADSAPPTGGGWDSSSNAANSASQSSGNQGAGVDNQSSGDQGAGGSSTTGSDSSPNSPGFSSDGAESSSNGAESSPNEEASSAGNDKPAAGRESSPDGPASSPNGPGSNTGDQSTPNLPDTEQGDASSNDDSASRNPGL